MITAIRQKAGSTAEVIIFVDEDGKQVVKKPMTGADWLNSGLCGLWADRTDIGDSLEFARSLRKQAERRYS